MAGLGKRFVAPSAAFALLLAGPLVNLVTGCTGAGDWRTASREPAGLAPAADTHPEPVIQVYAARAFGWRGAFAVHTWIAAKPAGAERYTVYEVIGWGLRHGGSALAIHEGAPDRYWYGSRPEILADLRGEAAGEAIREIDAAARAYPYRDRYTVWPGPNSTTFTAWVGRAVPALRLDLPATAIGKDWLDSGRGEVVAAAPSNTGWQVSLFGLFGVLAGVEEGVEINLAGLTVGVDPLDFALKLPGFGRVGGVDGGAARAEP